jgi:hypothetical protein
MKFKVIASLLVLLAILGAWYIANSDSVSVSKPAQTVNDGIKLQ